MPASWELIDDALSHLDSPAFNDSWYALLFRGKLELELKRMFEWLDYSVGSIELHPSSSAVWLAEIVLELKGSEAVGPCDLVREALLILDTERAGGDGDGVGRIPARLINNYMTLKYALEFGDCSDWSVLALAKQIIFMEVRDSDSL